MSFHPVPPRMAGHSLMVSRREVQKGERELPCKWAERDACAGNESRPRGSAE